MKRLKTKKKGKLLQAEALLQEMKVQDKKTYKKYIKY